MTESTRQFPGVKGSWILCSECPPTEADVDTNGDLHVVQSDLEDWYFVRWYDVKDDEYWMPFGWTCLKNDPRPIALTTTPCKPALAVGQVWETATYKQTKIIKINQNPSEDRFYANNGYGYHVDGKAYTDRSVGDHIKEVELITLLKDVDPPLPATSINPTNAAKKYDKLYPIPNSNALYAIAEDGTAWHLRMYTTIEEWLVNQLPDLS